MWNNVKNINGKMETKRELRDFSKQILNLNITYISHHVTITILCVSCHGLEIETSRYHKPKPLPIRDSLCHTCQQVEDEVNFFCTCKKCFII